MLDNKNNKYYGVDSGCGSPQNWGNLQSAYSLRSHQSWWTSKGVKGAVLGLGLATLLPMTSVFGSVDGLTFKWDGQTLTTEPTTSRITVDYGTALTDELANLHATAEDASGNPVTGTFELSAKAITRAASEKVYPKEITLTFTPKGSSKEYVDGPFDLKVDFIQSQIVFRDSTLTYGDALVDTSGDPEGNGNLNAYTTTLDVTSDKYPVPVIDGTFTYTVNNKDGLEIKGGQTYNNVFKYGTYTLWVEFVPNDPSYRSQTATATLTVNKAPATVTWFVKDLPYGDVFGTSYINYSVKDAAGNDITTSAAGSISSVTQAGQLGGSQALPMKSNRADARQVSITYSSQNYEVKGSGDSTYKVDPAVPNGDRVNVVKNTPTVTWAQIGKKIYGVKLADLKPSLNTQVTTRDPVNNNAPLKGNFVYTWEGQTINDDFVFPETDPNTGTLGVTFEPTGTDANHYNNSVEKTQKIRIYKKKLPVLTWTPPGVTPPSTGKTSPWGNTYYSSDLDDIYYGTALGADQLTAVATDPVSKEKVRGSYTYSDSEGHTYSQSNPDAQHIVLETIGVNELTVTFKPDSTIADEYESSIAYNNIEVLKVTPTINNWKNVTKSYGTRMSEELITELKSLTAKDFTYLRDGDPTKQVNGEWDYDFTSLKNFKNGDILPLNSYKLFVKFTPTDDVHFNSIAYGDPQTEITLTIGKYETPIIWSTDAIEYFYGSVLTANDLNATFEDPRPWTINPAIDPQHPDTKYETDQDGNIVYDTVGGQDVARIWGNIATFGEITYSAINKATGGPSYNNVETITVIAAGQYTLRATLTPYAAYTADYAVSTADRNLTVKTIDPSKYVKWDQPSEITYGTPLTPATFSWAENGTPVTVGGTGTYVIKQGNQTVGTYSTTATLPPLHAGSYTVTLTEFNPSTGNYVAVSANNRNQITKTVAVKKATLTVTPKSYTIDLNDNPPTYEATITGYEYDDTDAVLKGWKPELHAYLDPNDKTTEYKKGSKVGIYTIQVTNKDKAAVDDYTIDLKEGALYVGLTPEVVWAVPADIDNETALSETQLDNALKVIIHDADGDHDITKECDIVFEPAKGTKLNPGMEQTLNANIKPHSSEYKGAADMVGEVKINVYGKSHIKYPSSETKPNPTTIELTWGQTVGYATDTPAPTKNWPDAVVYYLRNKEDGTTEDEEIPGSSVTFEFAKVNDKVPTQPLEVGNYNVDAKYAGSGTGGIYRACTDSETVKVNVSLAKVTINWDKLKKNVVYPTAFTKEMLNCAVVTAPDIFVGETTLQDGTKQECMNGKLDYVIPKEVLDVTTTENPNKVYVAFVPYPEFQNHYDTTILEATINVAPPALTATWDQPDAIDYGVALSDKQFNEKIKVVVTSDSRPVEGAVTAGSEKPALDTVLNAGTHKLTATFSPDDANYLPFAEGKEYKEQVESIALPTSGKVELTVNKIDPLVEYDIEPVYVGTDAYDKNHYTTSGYDLTSIEFGNALDIEDVMTYAHGNVEKGSTGADETEIQLATAVENKPYTYTVYQPVYMYKNIYGDTQHPDQITERRFWVAGLVKVADDYPLTDADAMYTFNGGTDLALPVYTPVATDVEAKTADIDLDYSKYPQYVYTATYSPKTDDAYAKNYQEWTSSYMGLTVTPTQNWSVDFNEGEPVDYLWNGTSNPNDAYFDDPQNAGLTVTSGVEFDAVTVQGQEDTTEPHEFTVGTDCTRTYSVVVDGQEYKLADLPRILTLGAYTLYVDVVFDQNNQNYTSVAKLPPSRTATILNIKEDPDHPVPGIGKAYITVDPAWANAALHQLYDAVNLDMSKLNATAYDQATDTKLKKAEWKYMLDNTVITDRTIINVLSAGDHVLSVYFTDPTRQPDGVTPYYTAAEGFNPLNVPIKVAKRTVNLTWPKKPSTITYGDTIPLMAVAKDSVDADKALPADATLTYYATQGSSKQVFDEKTQLHVGNNGQYTLSVKFEASNYETKEESFGALTVNPAQATLVWNPDPMVYGSTITDDQKTAKAYFKPVYGEEEIPGSRDWFTYPSFDSGKWPKNVGEKKEVVLSFAPVGNNDFQANVTMAIVTMIKAQLNVIFNDSTVMYGTPTPDYAASVSYDKFVNDDDPSDLGGKLEFDVVPEYDPTAAPDTKFTVTPKGYTSNNYEISYTPGTLTVVQDTDLTFAFQRTDKDAEPKLIDTLTLNYGETLIKKDETTLGIYQLPKKEEPNDEDEDDDTVQAAAEESFSIDELEEVATITVIATSNTGAEPVEVPAAEIDYTLKQIVKDEDSGATSGVEVEFGTLLPINTTYKLSAQFISADPYYAAPDDADTWIPVIVERGEGRSAAEVDWDIDDSHYARSLQPGGNFWADIAPKNAIMFDMYAGTLLKVDDPETPADDPENKGMPEKGCDNLTYSIATVPDTFTAEQIRALENSEEWETMSLAERLAAVNLTVNDLEEYDPYNKQKDPVQIGIYYLIAEGTDETYGYDFGDDFVVITEPTVIPDPDWQTNINEYDKDLGHLMEYGTHLCDGELYLDTEWNRYGTHLVKDDNIVEANHLCASTFTYAGTTKWSVADGNVINVALIVKNETTGKYEAYYDREGTLPVEMNENNVYVAYYDYARILPVGENLLHADYYNPGLMDAPVTITATSTVIKADPFIIFKDNEKNELTLKEDGLHVIPGTILGETMAYSIDGDTQVPSVFTDPEAGTELREGLVDEIAFNFIPAEKSERNYNPVSGTVKVIYDDHIGVDVYTDTAEEIIFGQVLAGNVGYHTDPTAIEAASVTYTVEMFDDNDEVIFSEVYTEDELIDVELDGGTYVVTANFTPADTARYAVDETVSAPLTVVRAQQWIDVDDIEVSKNPVYAGDTVTLSGVATPSGLVLTFDSTNPDILKPVEGENGKFIANNPEEAETVVIIIAKQDGDNNYGPAPEVEIPITVIRRNFLKVTPDDKSVVYGQPLPELTYTVDPSEFQEMVIADIEISDDYDGSVNTYKLYANVDDTTIPEGYVLDEKSLYGTLEVTPAPLEVTVGNVEFTYQAEDAIEKILEAITIEPEEFQLDPEKDQLVATVYAVKPNGEDGDGVDEGTEVVVVTTIDLLDPEATANDVPAGSYTLFVTLTQTSNPNYVEETESTDVDNLTVVPAEVIIIPDSQEMDYNAKEWPDLTWMASVEGVADLIDQKHATMVVKAELGVFDEGKTEKQYLPDAKLNPGIYDIRVVDIEVADNYTAELDQQSVGKLVVRGDSENVVVTWDVETPVAYGNTIPLNAIVVDRHTGMTLAYGTTSLVAGTELSYTYYDVNHPASMGLELTVDNKLDVGLYDVWAIWKTDGLVYETAYFWKRIEVVKADVTAIVKSDAITYGQELPPDFEENYFGYIAPEGVVINLSSDWTPESPAGQAYPIHGVLAEDYPNYNITIEDGELYVEKADQTIEWVTSEVNAGEWTVIATTTNGRDNEITLKSSDASVQTDGNKIFANKKNVTATITASLPANDYYNAVETEETVKVDASQNEWTIYPVINADAIITYGATAEEILSYLDWEPKDESITGEPIYTITNIKDGSQIVLDPEDESYIDAGKYALEVRGLTSDIYDLDFEPAEELLSIDRAELTVNVSDDVVLYGTEATLSNVTVELEGLLEDDPEDFWSDLEAEDYYVGAPVDAEFTITVKVDEEALSKNYDIVAYNWGTLTVIDNIDMYEVVWEPEEIWYSQTFDRNVGYVYDILTGDTIASGDELNYYVIINDELVSLDDVEPLDAALYQVVAEYEGLTSAEWDVYVNPIPQEIVVDIPSTIMYVGDTAEFSAVIIPAIVGVNLPASGLDVNPTVIKGQDVLSLDGNKITANKIGTATIRFEQVGTNDNYVAAKAVDLDVEVEAGDTLSFIIPEDIHVTYGTDPLPVIIAVPDKADAVYTGEPVVTCPDYSPRAFANEKLTLVVDASNVVCENYYVNELTVGPGKLVVDPANAAKSVTVESQTITFGDDLREVLNYSIDANTEGTAYAVVSIDPSIEPYEIDLYDAEAPITLIPAMGEDDDPYSLYVKFVPDDLENYEVTVSDEVELTVDKADLTVTVGNAVVWYNAEADLSNVTVTADFVKGDESVLETTAPESDYYVGALPGEEFDITVEVIEENYPNYNISYDYGTLTVVGNPDNEVIFWTVPSTINYGTKIALNAKVIDRQTGKVLAQNDELLYSWYDATSAVDDGVELTADTILDAGEYYVSAYWKADGIVYADTYIWLPVTVVPAQAELTVTANPAALNVGQTTEITLTTTSDATPEIIKIEGNALEPVPGSATKFLAVNEGTTTITAAVADTESYLGTTAFVTVTVSPKPVLHVTIKGFDVFYGDIVEYDKVPVTITGLIDGDVITATANGKYHVGDPVDSYPMWAEFSGDTSKYALDEQYGDVNVKPMPVYVMMDDLTVQYDTYKSDVEYLIRKAYTMEPEDAPVEVTPYSTYQKGDIVGEYPGAIKAEASTNNKNYNPIVEPGTLTVAKRDITVYWEWADFYASGPIELDGWAYYENGFDAEYNTIYVTVAEGDELDYTAIAEDGTEYDLKKDQLPAGHYQIYASYAGSDLYEYAESRTYEFTVWVDPEFEVIPEKASLEVGDILTISWKSLSDGEVEAFVDNSGVLAQISATEFKAVKKGTAYIYVYQYPTDVYAGAGAEVEVTVDLADPEFEVIPSTTSLNVGETMTVSWESLSDGKVTAVVDDSGVLEQISATEFKGVKEGTGSILVTLAETQVYAGAKATVTVSVTKKDPTKVTVTLEPEKITYIYGEEEDLLDYVEAINVYPTEAEGTLTLIVTNAAGKEIASCDPANELMEIVLDAGTYALTAVFTPFDEEEYTPATSNTVVVTVEQAFVDVATHTADGMVAGDNIKDYILPCTTTPEGVTGRPIYGVYVDPEDMKDKDPILTVDPEDNEYQTLDAGIYFVRAELFIPDSDNYRFGEAEYDTLVVEAVPTVVTIEWNVPAKMVYGTEIECNAKVYVFGEELDPLPQGAEVKYLLDDTVEIPADEPLMLFVGKYNLKAVFVAPVGAGYTDAVTSIDIEVTKAPLTVTLDPDPAEVVYGETLVLPEVKIEGLLEGDMVEYDVTSIYHADTTAAGTYKDGIIATLSVGSDNYVAPEQVTSTLTVKKATQEVLLAVNPTVLNVGDSATATVVTTSGLPVTIAISDTSILSPNLVALKVGTVTVIAKQAGDNNYEPAESDPVEVTVAPKADVQITWEPKSPITYGTILSAEHLNATASLDGQTVEGHFYYNPTFGYVVTPESPFVVNGKLRLSATFIPTDRKRFKNAYTEVLIDIVVEEDDTTDDGEDAPTLTISKAGSVKGMVNAAADALVITFTGTLEESTDGVTWTPVADAKDGTYVVDVKVASKKFYRSAK